MFEILKNWRDRDRKTFWFYFQLVVYSLAIILSTIYAYGRLDFVRSGPKTAMEHQK